MFNRGLILKSAIGLRSPFSQISTRFFSSSSPANAVVQRRKPVRKTVRAFKANLRKEANILKQRRLFEKENKLDPVLGERANAFISRLEAEVGEPHVMVKGFERQEVDKLLYGAQEASVKADFASDSVRQNAIKQREAVYRILNMKNSSRKEALKFKTALTRKEFQRFDGDTGSSEVQAAIATVKIRNLFQHIKENKKDNRNTRTLRMLVQHRQRILRYLKRDNPERYYWALNKLGLNDRVIHMQFNMDRAYMQKYKWFGDRVLVKLSQNQKERLRKEKRLEKKEYKMKKLAQKAAAQKAHDRLHGKKKDPKKQPFWRKYKNRR